VEHQGAGKPKAKRFVRDLGSYVDLRLGGVEMARFTEGTAVSEDLPQLRMRLERHWIDSGSPIGRHLRPGATPQAIRAAERELGFVFPEEVRSWWSWHDGAEFHAEVRSSRSMGPWVFEFLPLAEALRSYRMHRDVAQSMADRAPRAYERDALWPPTRMVLSDDSLGASLALDCHDPTSATAPVRWFHWEWCQSEAVRKPVLPSLTALVSRWVELFDRGVVNRTGIPGGSRP
jgi:cell wall assembly regulator SMI1